MSLGPSPTGALPPLPRPGPDPIPWPDSSHGMGLLRAVGIAIAAALILTLLARASWRWIRASRARAAFPAMPPPGASAAELATAARAAIVAALGDSWAARTTEEIADSQAALRPLFGADRTERLLAFLHQADQARFAGHSEPDDASRPVVAEILDAARSITTGR